MRNTMKALQKLNDTQLFLAFAVMTSLSVNSFFGLVFIITGASFWLVYLVQVIISLIALLLIKQIKD